jgi:hypothetical protein
MSENHEDSFDWVLFVFGAMLLALPILIVIAVRIFLNIGFGIIYFVLYQYIIVFAAQLVIFVFMAYGAKFLSKSFGMLKTFQVSTIVKGMLTGCIVGMLIYGLFGDYLYFNVYSLYRHPSNSYFYVILTGCLISVCCSFFGALIARDFARK